MRNRSVIRRGQGRGEKGRGIVKEEGWGLLGNNLQSVQ